ncbi:hypothetical protein NDU88_006822 [Pleurodeles waltl]|uniref:Uncharacterized protein n=1 Tax=Pleurodeles waltl TaxID=8319 RepID=A0AAV7WBV4_PLEWA|nr:hypothetical protein NDU88_006822 [Pleurodeles waltl]
MESRLWRKPPTDRRNTMYCPHYYNSPIRHLFRADSPRTKTQRKQDLEGKMVTSTHPTRIQDAMEPELQILPAFIFLLLYQEQQRWRRRPHGAGGGGVLFSGAGGVIGSGACGSGVLGSGAGVGGVLGSGAGGGGVLFSSAGGGGVLGSVPVVAVSLPAVLVGAVSLAVVLVAAVSLAAMLVAVLSGVQVFLDLPVLLCPFPTLDCGAAGSTLPTVPLGAALVGRFFSSLPLGTDQLFVLLRCSGYLEHWLPCCLAHSRSRLLLAPLFPQMLWLRRWVGTWRGGP